MQGLFGYHRHLLSAQARLLVERGSDERRRVPIRILPRSDCSRESPPRDVARVHVSPLPRQYRTRLGMNIFEIRELGSWKVGFEANNG